MSEPRVGIVTPDLSENSLGRTYCLWLLCQSLGWHSQTVAVQGDGIWLPLRDTEFAKSCSRLAGGSVNDSVSQVSEFAESVDLLIAVKTLPTSFPIALAATDRLSKPLLLDMDDPDLEAWTTPDYRPRVIARNIVRHSRRREMFNMARDVARVPLLVSNPYLQDKYGGTLIPHVRALDRGEKSPHESDRPSVAFVGTNRRHKGVGVLRGAVDELAEFGYTLTITDAAPRDAKPWERWIGNVSMEDGMRLVAASDIVAIPSLDVPFAHGQLPAKLVDAMMLGRALVVSDIEPMPWAIGDGGLVVRPGDRRQLRDALVDLRDPRLRSRFGDQAAERARAIFSVDAVAAHFKAACERVLAAVG